MHLACLHLKFCSVNHVQMIGAEIFLVVGQILIFHCPSVFHMFIYLKMGEYQPISIWLQETQQIFQLVKK